MSNFSRGGSGGGGGSSAGMTIVEKEITTFDATPTSFGSLFTPVVEGGYLCNIRIISVGDVSGGDFATFQWLGSVIEDVGNSGVFTVHNGTASAAPDTFNGASAGLIRLSIDVASQELRVRMTGVAGRNYIHRLVLEYSPLVFS